MKAGGLAIGGVIVVGLVVMTLLNRSRPAGVRRSQPPPPAVPARPQVEIPPPPEAAAAPLPVAAAAPAAPEAELEARVAQASGAPVRVKRPRLKFSYVPDPGQLISFYNPSDYPTLDSIPLASGQRASFAAIATVVFTNVERREQVFVAEGERGNYAPGVVDKTGHRTATTRSIQAVVTTAGGETVTDTVQCPDHAGVALVGETSIGTYEKSLWGLRRPLEVTLVRAGAGEPAKR